MEIDRDIPLHASSELSAYPHAFTHEERFQPYLRIQPVGDSVEIYLRNADTRLFANAARRLWEGSPKRQRSLEEGKDRSESIAASSRRRRRQIRLLCVNAKVDRMYTFTTRPLGGKILTRDQFDRAWSMYRRMIVQVYPSFNYVAVVEIQPESKQFHVHAGVRGRYSVDVIRETWHKALNHVWCRDLSLVHGEDSPGNVHIKYKPSGGTSKVRAAVRIAGYIAKYIGKDADGTRFNRKGYFHRLDNVVPKPQHFWMRADDVMREVFDRVVAHYGLDDAMTAPDTDFFMMDTKSFFVRVPKRLFNPPPF
jgi:hypothetical protein